MAIKRAKRQQLRLAMALIGPSGSGKTIGGLILAFGMMKTKYPKLDDYDLWGKIGLIDTEHERSLVYEGITKGGVKIGQFWHKDLQAPYSVEAYTKAALEMKAEGVEVVVVDSLSHAWTGEGGVLDHHEESGGKFQSWNATNKQAYYPLVSFAVGESTGLHMINTIRSKQDHAMQPGEDGKMQVVKLGLQPVQRDQFEYEFQIALNVDMDHKVRSSKDNSDIFENFHDMLTPKHGEEIFHWLETGVDIFAEREAEKVRLAEEAEKAKAEQEKKRLEIVKAMRKMEKEHKLQEWVTTNESHPGINGKLEDLDYTKIERFHQAMLGRIQKIKDEEGRKAQ